MKKPFADTKNASVTTTTYDSTASKLTVETKINGTTVAKKEEIYGTNQVTHKVYTESGKSLDTVYDYYALNDSASPGALKKITYPDGTILTKSYTFPGAGTKIVTTFRGAADGSEGTSTEVTLNKLGATNMANVTNVGTGGSVFLSKKQINEANRDDLGRALQIDYLTGTDEAYSTTRQYGCCGLQQETDRSGISTYYAYDGMKRRIKVNRLGLTTETRYSGLTTHTYRYPETGTVALLGTALGTDADEISRTTRYVSDTASSQWRRNATGADYHEDHDISVVTTYLNPAHSAQSSLPAGIGMKSTTYYPQTADDDSVPYQTNETNYDGSTFQNYGQISPVTRYTYTVGALGVETKRTVGVGNNEPVITRTDWAGRKVETEYYGNVKAMVEYNDNGQMVKNSDPDGVTTFYEYNIKGERTTTVLDLNGNDLKDPAIDQYTYTISTPSSYTEGSDDYPVITTRTTVYQDGATYPNGGTVVSESHRTIGGTRTWNVSLPGGANLTTKSVTSLTGSGNSTVTTTAADNSYTVRTTTGGLLASVESFDSAGVSIATSSYTDESGQSGYDSHNRPTHVTNSATGTAVTEYVSAVTDYVDNVTDAAGNTTSYGYDIRNRRTTEDAPDSHDAQGGTLANITTTHYFPFGGVKEVTGGQTYRRTYAYDYAARMKTMTTYGTETAITAWAYDTNRGWLLRKRYGADIRGNYGTGPDYTYTDGGRLETREWARTGSDGINRVLTTYEYDGAGRLKKTQYSNTLQGTPDLYNIYDRLSRLRFNIQGGLVDGSDVRVHEYSYDPTNLQLDEETIVEGVYDSAATGTQYTSSHSFKRVLDRARDTQLRLGGWSLKNGSTVEHDVSYAYMSGDSRLLSVTGHGQSHTYGYKYDFSTQARTGNVTGTSQGYMPYTVISPAHTVVNTYEPNRNVLINKQNKATTGDVVRSNYLYDTNAVGQRISVVASGSSFITAPAYAWSYNARGELVEADDSSTANNDRAYQYDGIGNREKTADGLLTALPATANYIPNELNQYTKANGVTLPTPAYDLDGNYTNGPLPVDQTVNATLLWNAENRLVSSTLSGTTTTYEYDYLGRRVAKVQGAAVTRYVYDGWNVIAEYAGTTLGKTYIWGMDLSGSMQGAGGVGGLLSAKLHTGQNVGTYYPTYDGNGNISEYLDSAGAVQAHYEYDAFGNTTVTTGTKAAEFVHRFSTKPLDAETGLYYYGYRYYDASIGRWINRDPIEENGGYNLYEMIGNNSINSVDFLGLDDLDDDYAAHPWEPESCLCCCAENVDITEGGRIDNFEKWGTRFTANINLLYKKSNKEGIDDCTLEWWEKTNVPPSAFSNFMRPSTWTDMFHHTQNTESHFWRNWHDKHKGRGLVTLGPRTISIVDEPVVTKHDESLRLRTVDRTLEFKIIIRSSKNCDCAKDSVSVSAIQWLKVVKGKGRVEQFVTPSFDVPGDPGYSGPDYDSSTTYK